MAEANTATVNADKELVWNSYKTPFASVPEVSLMVLAQRGFTHVLGNEQAARLVAWRKTDEGKNADQAAIDAFLKKIRDEAFEKIMAGTLGQRTSGAPRVTGIEAYKRTVAVEWLKAKLGDVKLPTGDKTILVGPKDAQVAMTREQLIANTIKRREAEITALAEKRMAEDEAKRAESASIEGTVEDIFAAE